MCIKCSIGRFAREWYLSLNFVIRLPWYICICIFSYSRQWYIIIVRDRYLNEHNDVRYIHVYGLVEFREQWPWLPAVTRSKLCNTNEPKEACIFCHIIKIYYYMHLICSLYIRMMLAVCLGNGLIVVAACWHSRRQLHLHGCLYLTRISIIHCVSLCVCISQCAAAEQPNGKQKISRRRISNGDSVLISSALFGTAYYH